MAGRNVCGLAYGRGHASNESYARQLSGFSTVENQYDRQVVEAPTPRVEPTPTALCE